MRLNIFGMIALFCSLVACSAAPKKEQAPTTAERTTASAPAKINCVIGGNPENTIFFFLDSLESGERFPVENSTFANRSPRSNPVYSTGSYVASDYATFLSMKKDLPMTVFRNSETGKISILKQTNQIVFQVSFTSPTESRGSIYRIINGSETTNFSALRCTIER